MRNIILVGFMGTGKTTVATKLSHRLKMRYISTDDLIEKQEKRTINEIFTRSGEEYFRQAESSVIRQAAGMDGVVVDAGGGAVLLEENVAALKSAGIMICLTASEEDIIERTKRYKHRPLLDVEDPKRKIRDLLAKRAPFYAKADHTLDTSKLTVKQVVDKIIELIESGLVSNKEDAHDSQC